MKTTAAREVCEPVGAGRERDGGEDILGVPADHRREGIGLRLERAGTSAGTCRIVDTEAQVARCRFDVE